MKILLRINILDLRDSDNCRTWGSVVLFWISSVSTILSRGEYITGEGDIYIKSRNYTTTNACRPLLLAADGPEVELTSLVNVSYLLRTRWPVPDPWDRLHVLGLPGVRHRSTCPRDRPSSIKTWLTYIDGDRIECQDGKDVPDMCSVWTLWRFWMSDLRCPHIPFCPAVILVKCYVLHSSFASVKKGSLHYK